MMLTHNGKTQSVNQWGKELKLLTITIYARLQNGATVAEALRPIERKSYPRKKPKTITYNGETKTIPAWSAELGIHCTTIYDKMKKGITDPATLLGMAQQTKTYNYDGEELTIAQWAEKLGITHAAMRHRIFSDLPPEIIFSGQKVIKTYTCDGESLSIGQWARKLKMTLQGLYLRLKKYPAEIALNNERYEEVVAERWRLARSHPNQKKRNCKTYYLHGKRLSVREWAESLGCSPERFRYYLKTYPMEQAVAMAKIEKRTYQRKPVLAPVES